MSAAQSDGVVDALQHPQLIQVYLRGLRLGGRGREREGGGKKGKREGGWEREGWRGQERKEGGREREGWRGKERKEGEWEKANKTRLKR